MITLLPPPEQPKRGVSPQELVDELSGGLFLKPEPITEYTFKIGGADSDEILIELGDAQDQANLKVSVNVDLGEAEEFL